MGEEASDYVKLNNGEGEGNEITPEYEKVREFFSPLRENWSVIQEVLLWQKLEEAILCFNIINGLFWVFLTPCFRNCVIFIVITSLLWLVPPLRLWVLSKVNTRKLSAKSRRDRSDDSEVEDSSEHTGSTGRDTRNKKNVISYEDFCYHIAIVWGGTLKYYTKFKVMKDENPQKFYAILALLFILLAIFYQQFPVGNILYLIIMFVFLWPAIIFYGIKDKFIGKIQKLFKPFFTQWQNSQTRRKRNLALNGVKDESDLSDDDDFTLNTKETKNVLHSALPAVDKVKQESRHHGHFDSLDSSVVSTEGLEFPSLRRDSVESYNSDDFTDGLNFGSIHAVGGGSCHSSMDSLVGEDKERENMQSEHTELTRRNEEMHLPESLALSSEDGVKTRIPIKTDHPTSLTRNKSSDSLQSYEIVDTAEVENDPTLQSSTAERNEGSYFASGAGYVGKLFGYS